VQVAAPSVDPQSIADSLCAHASILLAVGQVERARDAEQVLNIPGAPRWAAAAKAILARDATTAADLLAEIGHRPAGAYARLRTGDAELNGALAFYRSVGATRYVREAEVAARNLGLRGEYDRGV
jgi:hypothetical protein